MTKKDRPNLDGLIPDLKKAREINKKVERKKKEEKKIARKKPQILLGVNLPIDLYEKFEDFMFSRQEHSLSKVFRDMLKEIFENPEVNKEFIEFFENYNDPKKVKTKFTMLVLDDETKKILDDKIITLRVRAKSKLVRALIKFFVQRE